MKTLSRREFLGSASKAAAGLLLGRTFVPTLSSNSAFVVSLWSGAVTPYSARVNARIDHDSTAVRLVVSPDPLLTSPIFSDFQTAILATNNRMVGLEVDGLLGDTQYYYGIEADGVLDDVNLGQFRTPPTGAHSFTFAFASCAETASAHQVFETIRLHSPSFFLHMGDMHYENISTNDRSVYRAAYDAVLSSSTQSALYRSVPIAYMWDDHDYGPNDSDETAPGREAARLTYQEYVPHYPLVTGSGDVPIYQAFSFGRVRFILTDLRSERSPKTTPDDASKTMMGVVQKAWFKNELLMARDHYAAVVWLSTVPWIGAASADQDYWAGYSTERQELATFIRDNHISHLVMLSGDAHMIALDDGSNNDYAAGGGAAFPLMHAAALDRPGSLRGGPYSHGAYPGQGQFGLCSVVDDGGDTIEITLSGRDAANNTVVEHAFNLTRPGAGNLVYLPTLSR